MKALLALAFASALLLFGCAAQPPDLPPSPPSGGEQDVWSHIPSVVAYTRSPGFAANPVREEYNIQWSAGKAYLRLNISDVMTGNSTIVRGQISQEEYLGIVNTLEEGNFWQMDDSYTSCSGGFGCPTDMGSFSLKMQKNNATKAISIYDVADRPQALDDAVARILAAYSNSNKTYSMSKELCESARGSWNECASACRGAPEGTACTLQCVQQCECGGFAGFGCPAGYSCTDYLPKGAADAMGVCKLLY